MLPAPTSSPLPSPPQASLPLASPQAGRGSLDCHEQPAQLPPYTGGPQARVLVVAVTITACTEQDAIPAVPAGGTLCAPHGLAGTLSKTNPAPQQPRSPSLLPPASPCCGGMPGADVGSAGQGEATGSGLRQEATGQAPTPRLSPSAGHSREGQGRQGGSGAIAPRSPIPVQHHSSWPTPAPTTTQPA